MLEWSDVQVFLAVARAGSLQQAGARLGIDRTTVGRRVVQLERRLGAPLFTRGRAGLALTAAGRRAVQHATAMEAAGSALEAEVAPADQVTGTVRVATTEAIAPLLVQEGLLSLTAEHVGLSIEVLAGNRRIDLAAGEADLAVRLEPLSGASLRARCVVRSAIALYASRPYLSRRGPPTEKRLAGHDAVLPSGELPAPRGEVAQGAGCAGELLVEQLPCAGRGGHWRRRGGGAERCVGPARAGADASLPAPLRVAGHLARRDSRGRAATGGQGRHGQVGGAARQGLRSAWPIRATRPLTMCSM